VNKSAKVVLGRELLKTPPWPMSVVGPEAEVRSLIAKTFFWVAIGGWLLKAKF
jgi:hypothetical protein